MSEEYQWSLDNQASCVSDVMSRYKTYSFEANLCQLILGLTERLERLVEVWERYTRQFEEPIPEIEEAVRKAEPLECLAHECSYYSHYLVWWKAGGPRLDHDAFHAKEKACLEAQKELQKWMARNPTEDPERTPGGQHLWDTAVRLERQILA